MDGFGLGLGGGGGWFLGGGFGGGTDQVSGADGVELGPLRRVVRFPALLHGALIESSGVTVLVIHHFDNVHAFVVDRSEGSEALGIERSIVFQVDEDLNGARVGQRGLGEGERAALVFLSDRLVFNGGFVPRGVHGRIRVDTELHDEARQDAKKAGVIEIVMFDEIVKAVRGEGSPGAGDGNGEIAAGGFELDLIGVGRGVFEESGLEKSMVVGGLGGSGGGGGFRFGGRRRWLSG